MSLPGRVSRAQFLVVEVKLAEAAGDQEHSHEVEAEVNEGDDGGKVFDLPDLGHDLGNAEEQADPGRHQERAPDELQLGFKVVVHYPFKLPLNTALRFSRNALVPSLAS